jgi:pimeloyl-ACP methyl ester carboxylesterase
MMSRFGFALVCGVLLFPCPSRAEEGSFDSKGVKIHYYIEGEGEPVLLIHGFATPAKLQWGTPGIIKGLAKDHRVISFDVRGHGKSGKPTDVDKYGPEMVEDAVRLLDHLEIKKAHVVGYSMGALITGKLLATHPDRLLTATLGGAGVVPAEIKLPPFVEELAESLEKGKGMGPLWRALAPPGKPKPSEDVIRQADLLLVGDNAKALAAVVRSWKSLAVAKAQLKANKVPTLALIGSDDPLKESVELIKDDLANLKIVTIPDTDHITAFASPKFVEALRKFLAEHAQKKKAKERTPAGAGKTS